MHSRFGTHPASSFTTDAGLQAKIKIHFRFCPLYQRFAWLNSGPG